MSRHPTAKQYAWVASRIQTRDKLWMKTLLRSAYPGLADLTSRRWGEKKRQPCRARASFFSTVYKINETDSDIRQATLTCTAIPRQARVEEDKSRDQGEMRGPTMTSQVFHCFLVGMENVAIIRSVEQQYYNIILTRFRFPGFDEMMPRAANKGDMPLYSQNWKSVGARARHALTEKVDPARLTPSCAKGRHHSPYPSKDSFFSSTSFQCSCLVLRGSFPECCTLFRLYCPVGPKEAEGELASRCRHLDSGRESDTGEEVSDRGQNKHRVRPLCTSLKSLELILGRGVGTPARSAPCRFERRL